MRATFLIAAAALTAGACARAPRPRSLAPAPAAAPAALQAAPISVTCWSCTSVPMSPEMSRALERRLADLSTRGGECAVYGDVIERSYRSGLITIRPSMWRVGARLAAGEARPSGEMFVALEIDSLNAGVRPVDEVVWTVEHEAVHIAFGIESTSPEQEEKVESYVRTCRS